MVITLDEYYHVPSKISSTEFFNIQKIEIEMVKFS